MGGDADGVHNLFYSVSYDNSFYHKKIIAQQPTKRNWAIIFNQKFHLGWPLLTVFPIILLYIMQVNKSRWYLGGKPNERNKDEKEILCCTKQK